MRIFDFFRDNINKTNDVILEDLGSRVDCMITKSQTNQKDKEFINELWKFVLLAKNVNRLMPTCSNCGVDAQFTFEGVGGIAKVGNGVIFFPSSGGTIYSVPDIIFHDLYFHNVDPTPFFRELVSYSQSLSITEYFDKIESVYFEKNGLKMKNPIKCPMCNQIFEGTYVYTEGSPNKEVSVIDPLKRNLIAERRRGVCDKCHQIVSFHK